jgi:hypothetical protein
MVVTSPPYFGLRKYADGTEDDFGREKTVGEYVENTVRALHEIRRVLRPDGVVFWNAADSYHGSGRGMGATDDTKFNLHCDGNPFRRQGKAKSLCLIPERIAIALSDDGWIVRNKIIWEKPNCVPESVQDRCTSSYENVFMLTRNRQYYWNTDEAREPSVCWQRASLGGQKDGEMKEFTMRHSNKIGSSKTEKALKPHNPVGAGPKGDALISNGTHGERSSPQAGDEADAEHERCMEN